MKKLLLTVPVLLFAMAVLACPVCERSQPRILRGITHGAGPESNWDFLIVSVMVAITMLTLFLSVKWLIRPGERSEGHIKRFILNNE